MRPGDTIDNLGVGGGVFEYPCFKLKQLGNVAGGSRVVPGQKKRCRRSIAHCAELAILGNQIVDQCDPGGGECTTQCASLVGFHGI